MKLKFGTQVFILVAKFTYDMYNYDVGRTVEIRHYKLINTWFLAMSIGLLSISILDCHIWSTYVKEQSCVGVSHRYHMTYLNTPLILIL